MKPVEQPKPSERAAKAVLMRVKHMWDYNPARLLDDGEFIAQTIARETGCDAPDPAREIVRRLVEAIDEVDQAIKRSWPTAFPTPPLPADVIARLGELYLVQRDATALHAAGGG